VTSGDRRKRLDDATFAPWIEGNLADSLCEQFEQTVDTAKAGQV